MRCSGRHDILKRATVTTIVQEFLIISNINKILLNVVINFMDKLISKEEIAWRIL